ncbi:MAG: TRAP transporter small permease [Bacillota bacterium]|nr:TRAP transporter small permease [Bacillota bacterium]
MKSTLKKIGRAYNIFEEKLLVYSLIVTVIVIFIQIIMRYVFKNSLFGSEEFARYVFMWQIYLGASIGFREDKHITITLLTDHLSGTAKKLCAILADLIMLAFCVFIIYFGWVFLAKVASMNMVTPAMRIPFIFVYSSLPVSCVVIFIRISLMMFKKIKELFHGSADGEDAALPAAAQALEGGEN